MYLWLYIVHVQGADQNKLYLFRDRIELQVHNCSATYGDSIFTIQDVKLSKNEYNYAK